MLLSHEAQPPQQPLLVGLSVLAAAGGRVFHRGGAYGQPLLHDEVWQQVKTRCHAMQLTGRRTRTGGGANTHCSPAGSGGRLCNHSDTSQPAPADVLEDAVLLTFKHVLLLLIIIIM